MEHAQNWSQLLSAFCSWFVLLVEKRFLLLFLPRAPTRLNTVTLPHFALMPPDTFILLFTSRKIPSERLLYERNKNDAREHHILWTDVFYSQVNLQLIHIKL